MFSLSLSLSHSCFPVFCLSVSLSLCIFVLLVSLFFFSRPFVLFSGFLWSSFPGSLCFLSISVLSFPFFVRVPFCSFSSIRSFFSFSFILLLCSFLHCFKHTLTSCFSIPHLPTQPKKYINLLICISTSYFWPIHIMDSIHYWTVNGTSWGKDGTTSSVVSVKSG